MNFTKKIIFILLVASIASSTFSQTIVKKNARIVHVQKTDKIKVILKSTGEEMTDNELVKAYIKFGKYINLVPVIDENGELLHYIFDADKPVHQGPDEIPQINVAIGEPFPNFIFNTIDGETINLKELKDKIVIVRFELDANSMLLPQINIPVLDKQLNGVSGTPFVAIALFCDSKEEVAKKFNGQKTNFKLVADGWDFCSKYSVNTFPTTIVIDKNGNLLHQFFGADEIDFKSLFRN